MKITKPPTESERCAKKHKYAASAAARCSWALKSDRLWTGDHTCIGHGAHYFYYKSFNTCHCYGIFKCGVLRGPPTPSCTQRLSAGLALSAHLPDTAAHRLQRRTRGPALRGVTSSARGGGSGSAGGEAGEAGWLGYGATDGCYSTSVDRWVHASFTRRGGRLEVAVWLLYEGTEAHPIQRRRRAPLLTTAWDAITQLQIPPHPPSSPGTARFGSATPMWKGRRHSAQRSACKGRQEGGMGRQGRARRAHASQVGPDNGSAVWVYSVCSAACFRW